MGGLDGEEGVEVDFLENVSQEEDDWDREPVFERLVNSRVDVEVLVQNGPVAAEGDHSNPLAEGLQNQVVLVFDQVFADDEVGHEVSEQKGLSIDVLEKTFVFGVEERLLQRVQIIDLEGDHLVD